MKKNVLWMVSILLFSFSLVSQEEILSLGNIQFPRPFIHAQKNYEKGIYRVYLTPKADPVYFKVFNKKNEFLFEELAIKRPNTGKSKKFNFRIKNTFLKGFEYFRIQVTQPENVYLAFFVVQTTPEKAKEAEKLLPEIEAKTETETE